MAEFNRISELILKLNRGGLSAEEKIELTEWVGNSEERRVLLEQLTDGGSIRAQLKKMAAYDEASVRQKIEKEYPYAFSGRPVRRMWFRWVAAASILLILSTGSYFLFFNKGPEKQTAKAPVRNDVAPGGNKAMLTLGNGKQIILDSAANGLLARQGNMNVVKTDSGRLAYNITNEKPGDIVLNVLTTPRGGQYQLTLPDGSRVWLNAASSIKYPTAFIGRERIVEVTGEAYFEVAHNSRMPFKVKAGDEVIKDIGTEFNVNAYTDESSLNTTLLQGSIEISGADQKNGFKLIPGQQSQFANSHFEIVKNANLEQVTAWKNGLFNFNQVDLATVLRQLARWYDVEVRYEGSPPPMHFAGELPRDLNLSQVLKILAKVGVKFSIENKTIIVKP